MTADKLSEMLDEKFEAMNLTASSAAICNVMHLYVQMKGPDCVLEVYKKGKGRNKENLGKRGKMNKDNSKTVYTIWTNAEERGAIL